MVSNINFSLYFLRLLNQLKRNKDKGFTLIEVVIVIIIIGILAAIAIPTFLQQARRAYVAEIEASAQRIYTGQAQAVVEKGSFYGSFDQLSAEGYLAFDEAPSGAANEGSSENYIYTITSTEGGEALIGVAPRDGENLPSGAIRLYLDSRGSVRRLVCTDTSGDPIPSLAGLEQCPG